MANAIGDAVWDGAVLSRWHFEDGNVVRTQRQPGRRRILERQAELRKSPEATKVLEWGRLGFAMPETDLRVLQKQYPDLTCVNGELRTREWMRLLNLGVLDKYLYRDRDKSRARKVDLALPLSMTQDAGAPPRPRPLASAVADILNGTLPDG